MDDKIKWSKLLELKTWKQLIWLVVMETIRIVEHHSEHYTKIKIFGEEIKACSRCLGSYVACIICLPIFVYLYIRGVKFPFWHVIIRSYGLAFFTIIDFVSVDLFHLRKGNAKTRIVSGFLLGISAMLYFWMLPAEWWFRIGTLIVYCLIAMLLAGITEWKRKKDGKKAQINPS